MIRHLRCSCFGLSLPHQDQSNLEVNFAATGRTKYCTLIVSRVVDHLKRPAVDTAASSPDFANHQTLSKPQQEERPVHSLGTLTLFPFRTMISGKPLCASSSPPIVFSLACSGSQVARRNLPDSAIDPFFSSEGASPNATSHTSRVAAWPHHKHDNAMQVQVIDIPSWRNASA